jgi:hypothetical protein
VSGRNKRLVFHAETDLEDYLVVHLSPHLSLHGLDVLVVGRQVETTARGRIDLLAIDTNGVIYIVELKLNQASTSTAEQLLAYRRSMKSLTRQELIDVVAGGRLNIDLLRAFHRRFGIRLPETVNEKQVLMVIAASIHPRTAESLLELGDSAYLVSAFKYVVQADALNLFPCCLDTQEAEPHIATKRSVRRITSKHWRPNPLPRYRVRVDVKWFWLTHAHGFVSSLVTFKSVYDLYLQWARAQNPGSLKALSESVFGRQLATLAAASGEWNRVFLAPGETIDIYELLANPRSVHSRRDADHRIVAYQRYPEGEVPDAFGSSLGRDHP